MKYLGENKKEGQVLIGFSMETTNLIENSKEKLIKKNLDMIVANAAKTISSRNSAPTIIFKDGRTKTLKLTSKPKAAKEILDESIRIYKTIKTR